jgi:hypothetical protein
LYRASAYPSSGFFTLFFMLIATSAMLSMFHSDFTWMIGAARGDESCLDRSGRPRAARVEYGG